MTESGTVFVPWRDAGLALATARAEERLIVLVVAPPWCAFSRDLLERGFAGQEMARRFERDLVGIHLDPDEDPEAAAFFARAAAQSSDDLGPPLVIFLSPEGLPFFGGGYFARGPRADRPSLGALLDAALGLARAQPVKLRAEARAFAARAVGTPMPAVGELKGAGTPGPRVPQPAWLSRLLRADGPGREACLALLRRMARGGMRDHLGGGFHRASRDEHFIVPYFEKPLAQNAQLLLLYLEAARLTGDARFFEVSRGICDFIVGELRGEDGLFASALAADHDYYCFTPLEFQRALAPEEAFVAGLHFQITPHPSKHVLYGALEPQEIASRSGLDPMVVAARLRSAAGRLLAARRRRPAPVRSPRRIVSHQALAIEALLTAAQVLAAPELGTLALAALEAVDALAGAPAGEALRPYPHEVGAARAADEGPWFLTDSAALAWAHLRAYEAAGRAASLDRARALAATIVRVFSDPATGRLAGSAGRPEPARFGGIGHEPLEDDAMPSPAGTVLRLLTGLSRHGERPRWLAAARPLASAIAERLADRNGAPYGTCLSALAAFTHECEAAS